MPRDPRYDILFTPIKVGPKTFRNRFYASPQCTGFGADRPGQQAYHRGMKAAGGFAVVHTEWCAIHPEADEWPAITGKLWDDEDARNYQLMVEKVHEGGALAGVQLGFNGSGSENMDTRICARGVEQVPSDTFVFHSCYAMTKREIRELQQFYVDAAVRAVQVGFDVLNFCVNEDCTVIQQFLMPRYNHRTDEYGAATMEGRTRFLLEVVEQVREAVHDRCAVTVRLSIDTLDAEKRGIDAGETAPAIVELADHLVDLWDMEVCGPIMQEWGDAAGPSRFFREAYQIPYVAKVRPYTKKPIVAVSRWVHPDAMLAAVESGVIDLIGMARPGIADPFLPAKIDEGRTDEIRECIGCNICVSRYEQHTSIICTQNATIGEEYRRGWHPERFSTAKNRENDVLIVGAGPAGMECALVLARRGMRRVHLVDAEREMGGAVSWISRLPGLGEWGWVTDHRRIQLEKQRNVEFIGRTRLAARDVLDYGADLVVIANGSRWVGDGFNGTTHEVIAGADASLPWQLTPEQIMVEGKAIPGERVLVYDTDGYYMGASLAEKLARQGKQVTLVTSMAEVAPYMVYTLENHRQVRLLHRLGVTTVPAHVITALEPGRAIGYRTYAEWEPVTWEADAVVLVTMRRSDEDLFRELEADPDALAAAGIGGLYRIGDCVVPRLIADAVFDGHRLAREIDEANPAVPLPFIRERRTLTWTDADFDAVVTDRGLGWPVSSRLAERRI
jgi:dimethylamine/trimethylamine dehydrogenase